jgi:Protein of unknown function (DUF3500)
MTVGGERLRPLLDRMAEAAGDWLASLPPVQRAKASYPFPATEERTRWSYTPNERGGLPLAEMGPVQQRLAHRLTASGLSRGGYAAAAAIMGLENALDAIEAGAARIRAGPAPAVAATRCCTTSVSSASPGPGRGAGGSTATTARSTTPSWRAAASRPARCSWGPTRP